jgi:hypothetical protein
LRRTPAGPISAQRQNRIEPEYTPMRAEHEKLVSDIKESLALLRRSL